MNPTQFELLRVDRTLPTVFYSLCLQGMAADAVQFLYFAPPSPRKGESFLFFFFQKQGKLLKSLCSESHAFCVSLTASCVLTHPRSGSSHVPSFSMVQEE